jgi:hypothetical protein
MVKEGVIKPQFVDNPSVALKPGDKYTNLHAGRTFFYDTSK